MSSASAPRTAAPGRLTWRDGSWWRARLEDLATLWRRSLRFRTVAITLALTAFAVLTACLWMALAIQNDLFESRKDQALTDSRRAVDTAQATLDDAVVQDDPVQVQNLMNSVWASLVQQSATDMMVAIRIDKTPSQLAPPGFRSGGLTEDMISPELRKHVQTPGQTESQWGQSISLPSASGSQRPGIVVGQQLVVPDIGPYELYLAYDLDDAAGTLSFVQATLWVVGSVLLVIIGGIGWFTLRAVTGPIREAAATSAKLASGDLDVRLTVHGEDELATLGRSFNAMADSIQSQITQLADLSLVQQRFVSDVSHELRTPLTTIRLAADMINDHRDEFDAATARAAELLHAQVQRFEVLLGDLLEISRYDAGSVQLELEPTSLAHLAEDVVASMQQLADQHGTDVRVVAPGGYSPVEMDPRRIRRIVRNLIGNAIEHGEGRPIVVTVDSNQQAVALGVRDFGMGMTETDAERVFDRFWRADPSRTRTIGGTGLGLSIALGDANLHQGTLTVWSQVGRGTNFVLTLPRGGHSVGAGASPIATDPGDDAGSLDDLGLTQPIVLHEGTRDRGGAA
ncbi:HAMP domain-containing protein [Microbacterium sp. SYP-A9085]|uniref:MtrAB system histidine kinase MtrB n=1 Tax=Microbacterium sp. SYP-A9085 TaxID=2664454 RepID=UPI00129A7169|nr:MtrAB system histidine kinase MtrB [Microbacterium sp. SYP-A9085]MRH28884.1 HAMP domain-containing protein [Microbacterium sp. SYP-A9085]